MRDQRKKAQRDYDWMLSTARTQGLKEGREEGREEGLKEGFKEGIVIGGIQILQQVLGEQVSARDDLVKNPITNNKRCWQNSKTASRRVSGKHRSADKEYGFHATDPLICTGMSNLSLTPPPGYLVFRQHHSRMRCCRLSGTRVRMACCA